MTTGRYVVAALVFAALGAVALVTGLVEHRIARAEEMLMSLDFAGTATAYDELAQFVGSTRYVPWMTGSAFDRVRARRAAARYWGGDYDALAAVARDAGAGGNEEVLFLAANSIYRLAQARVSDEQRVLRALDDARDAYLVVIRNGPGNPDAAFNYEYVSYLRDEIAKGRRGPTGSAGTGTLHGREGAPPPGRLDDEFKIYVPTETEEQKGLEPGGDQLRRRKG
jgi:hypothetical protein